MKSIKDFEKMCDIIVNNNLPREQMLFMNKDQKRETDSVLKNLGSSGIFIMKVPNTNIPCDILYFGGVTFYIINIDELQNY